MKQIIISDTHFGTKQNSIGWLNSQLEFFTRQFIPYLRSQIQPVRVVHLGDVFDSRSTISAIHAHKAQDIFAQIGVAADEFIVIGGNHDYYSPNTSEYCTLDVLFGNMQEIELVTHGMMSREDNLYVPWYSWLNDQEMILDLIGQRGITKIFTHADLVHGEIHPGIRSLVDRGAISIYSGHIHTPTHCNGLHTLGSTFALSFADCNSHRGFWELDDELEFIPNTHSIEFHRLYDEEIFNDQFPWYDYVEVYLSPQNISSPRFIERIKECNSHHKHFWVIPLAQEDIQEGIKPTDSDIERQIEECIPEYLKDKYEYIKQKVQEINQ